MSNREILLAVALACSASWPAYAQDHVHGSLPHNIPDFCANATTRSARSGAWSDPGTWLNGRVPVGGDKVRVAAGHLVTYDLPSSPVIACVGLNGSLTFSRQLSTSLAVTTLIVYADGRLEIGSEGAPVPQSVRSEIVFADLPIDTAVDPEQWGNGLIAFGKIRMHGAQKQPTFSRLLSEPNAGDVALVLADSPNGWEPGDTVILPDSRQLRGGERQERYVPQYDLAKVASISDNTVRLVQPLQFRHPGARNPDGHLEFLPHVANLSRNVVLRSANSAGTRGHVLMTERADVDIRYSEFRDLGRTTTAPLDVTTFDGSGAVTRIGTNQIGRYSLHLHHLLGPAVPQSSGYQYVLAGNSIWNGTKWGITIHGTHYGYVAKNVVFNAGGAGVMTEDGSESHNIIEYNFVAQTPGSLQTASARGYSTPQDFGHEGSGFWLRGPNNVVRHNVSAAGYLYGFTLGAWHLDPVKIPSRPGVAPDTLVDMTSIPLREFSDNESYGAGSGGLTVWWVGAYDTQARATSPSVIRNFTTWHQYWYGLFGYPTSRIVYDHFVARGDTSVLSNATEIPIGLYFSDYFAQSVTVRNADIQGMRGGIVAPTLATNPGSDPLAYPFIVEDSFLRNDINFSAQVMWHSNSGQFLGPRRSVIRNVRFGTLPSLPAEGQKNIVLSFEPGGAPNYIQSDRVHVYDYNGETGSNFRVYYKEQSPSFTVPATSHEGRYVGAPVAGLTNGAAMSQYGIAVGGSVAPCSNTVPEISGFVCSIDASLNETASPPAAPRNVRIVP